MAIPEEPMAFVQTALARGIPRATIQNVLLRAGWDPDQIRDALNAYADVEFPLPVPRPKPYLSAREAFLYLVQFTALYVSAYHLGQLVFQLIDLAFPDPALEPEFEPYTRATLRWAIANLVITFPIFLLLARASHRSAQRDPANRNSKIRRWLTYMTLFFAACIGMGDLIALVNGLLTGELTTRFTFKVLTIAVIAGTVFTYYLWDIRPDEENRT
jgi:hypothetical protein